jgi:hypothetical protein
VQISTDRSGDATAVQPSHGDTMSGLSGLSGLGGIFCTVEVLSGANEV